MQAGIDGTYLAGEANVAEITPEDDLAPEVKATIREFTARGLEMADQMIAAYGKPVNEYNPVDRWAMIGLLFGELCALGQITDFLTSDNPAAFGWLRGTTVAIAHKKLKYALPQSMDIAELYINHSGAKENPDLNILMHTGVEAYFLLDKPEELAEKLKIFFADTQERVEKARREWGK